jgi:hypothetical protein
MGMGIPVLHGVAGESAHIVQNEGIGIVFEPENASQLAKCLLDLKQDQGALKRFSVQALAAAPHFDRRILAREMLMVIDEAIEDDRA